MSAATVAAIATAPGVGGVGVIRISGSKALSALRTFVSAKAFAGLSTRPRELVWVHLSNPQTGTLIDQGLAVYFKAPESYTGEDVVELQLHGNPVLLNQVMRLLFSVDIRPAAPGEFTRRAFLNGKLDLLQAENVLATVEARSEVVLQHSVRQLEGWLSKNISAIRQDLLTGLAEIEVSLDYPDDSHASPLQAKFIEKLSGSSSALSKLAAGQENWQVLEAGARTVLVGLPNVGKSSLLNALIGEDRVLVSEVPGTTRDRVEVTMQIEDMLFCLTDTAGLREAGDVIEAMGIEKTHKAIATAGMVLYVLDLSRAISDEETKFLQRLATQDLVLIVVGNKMDLPPKAQLRSLLAEGYTVVELSARTGVGMEQLRQKMLSAVKEQHLQGQAACYLNERQLIEVKTALKAIGRALETVSTGLPIDLWTIDIRAAVVSLGRISGVNATEDMLDHIFSKFCVGK